MTCYPAHSLTLESTGSMTQFRHALKIVLNEQLLKNEQVLSKNEQLLLKNEQLLFKMNISKHIKIVLFEQYFF